MTERSIAYHDQEWGLPTRDERALFELLVLEGAQAGLSWETILVKREGYRRAFAGFDVERVARFGARERARLLADAGIVRHRGKIDAAIGNARAALAVKEEFGGLAPYLWGFVGDRPIDGRRKAIEDVPARTERSEAMSRDLARRGFTFVGPTICYSFMQATGMVNDHVIGCFRHREVARAGKETR